MAFICLETSIENPAEITGEVCTLRFKEEPEGTVWTINRSGCKLVAIKPTKEESEGIRRDVTSKFFTRVGDANYRLPEPRD